VKPFEIPIKQPVFITMVMLAILVIGGLSFTRMGVDLFPDVSVPIVAVNTVYPGANPEEVESQVTEPLEEALSSLNRVDRVRSTTREGLSTVIVEFALEYSARAAAEDVRERVAAIRNRLPQDIQEPVIQTFDPSALPILSFAVADREGRLSPQELRSLAEDTIKPRIERVEGVAMVDVIGGREREIQVDLDLDRLRALAIPVQQVVAALKSENLNLPAGRIIQGKEELLLRTAGEFSSVEEIGRTVVAQPRGIPIYLKDIATVRDGFKEVRTISRLNGVESVVLSVRKQSGTNTVRVAEGVRQQIAALLRENPGLNITIARDESVFIRETTDDVFRTLILGGILTSLVVFLFFRDLRNTLVTVVGLPVIIVGSFGAMYALGFTLNMITLLALSLSIGILIDDAIVVRENIFRHMELGEDPKEAAYRGTTEIALAVLATTLSIVAVFIPVAFTFGIVGKMFREFGLTVALAVLISLFEAFTLAPMLSAYFFKPMTQKKRSRTRLAPFLDLWGRLYDRLYRGYRPVLAWSLRHRILVTAIGTIAFLGSLGILPLLGTSFIGEMDRGRFELALELPPGTALEQTDRVARRAEEILFQQPEVENTFTTVGSNQGSVNNISIFVELKERGHTRELEERLRGLLDGLGKLSFQSQSFSISGSSMMAQAVLGKPIQVNIRGGTMEDLDALSRQAMNLLRDVPGLVDLDRSIRSGQPEVRFTIDRIKAADLGLSTAQIATTLRTLIQGKTASYLRQGSQETDIVVRLREADRGRLGDILSLTIPSPKGGQVPLRTVVRASRATGPSQIEREDRQRQVIIGANYYGRSQGDVVEDVTARLRSLKLPPSTTLRFAGETELMQQTFTALGLALALAVVFIYMVLASQFGSFLHPLSIMVALPLALVGAFAALLITGKNLDLASMMGMVLLMGLVAKNSILLVDFTNTLRRRGLERAEAILTAGPIRLRPIMMTTMAMIAGMLPVALGLGRGAEFRAPMGVAVIGGLLTSTLLTLVVVPVVYTFIDDLGRWRRGG
jgi:HAE1 family hydrophobic/amphiphilic exporter-1